MQRFACLVLVAACGSPAPPPETPTPASSGALAASAAKAPVVDLGGDRSADDQALDAGRKPNEMLAFFGIRPGMRVAEIVSGGGYTAEILARAVGEKGEVWGQNPKFILEKFAESPWSLRLGKPVMKNVHRVDRELEDPIPPGVKDLDAVIDVLFYHDTVWMKTDRDKMNRAIFAALRPGGVYGIIDHAAKAGEGVSVAETLHRIEEKTVVEEVTRAGFVLAEQSDLLRNPADTKDWSASPSAAGAKRGTSDRFMLKFVKK